LKTASQASLATQGNEEIDETLNKDDLVNELEGIYEKLTMQHSVVETNF
jgi:hypothetical protein